MSSPQALIKKLEKYIPQGDGHNSEFANDLGEIIGYLENEERILVLFASSALQGLLAKYEYNYELAAKKSVSYAKAMLAEMNRLQEEEE